MEIKSLYESVCYTKAIDTPRFINFLNQTIKEIQSKYKSKYISPDGQSQGTVKSMDDGLNIFGEYETPIIDNILYLATGDANKKTDFVAHLEYAYLTSWHSVHASRRRIGEAEDEDV